MSKVTIEEIGERLNSLDSIYYEELVGALKDLKNLGKNTSQYGAKEQRKELIDFYKTPLEQKDVDKIFKYVIDKMKGDYQLGAFKIIASEYISDESNIDKKVKPKCALIGEDGNIFHLMGMASRTLKRNGMSEEATEMCNRITGGAKSYDEALMILQDYVEITSKEELEEEEY